MIETHPTHAEIGVARPADTHHGGWPHRHLLDVDQLSREAAERCLRLAAEMRALRERGERLDQLQGHVVGLAFAEPSTRTRVSFEMAATALGAQVVTLPLDASSLSKGESLADTLRTLERTGVQTVVLRHAAAGAPYLAARATGLRVINAGDGAHAHPTQALLDALTLADAFGGVERMAGRAVAIVGDVAHSRVARSNLHLLHRLGVSVRLAGPPAWVRGFASWPGVDITASLEEALDGVDAVMALRVQLERDAAGGVPSLAEYSVRWGLNEERMRRARPGAALLHPGPTNEGVELTADLACGERSLIGRQVVSGVAIRMAVLSLLAP